jgi:SAM-dependent methyltransferase
MNLRDREASAAFFDRRYSHGYMDDWRADKRRRIFDLLAGLQLAATGTALDFGCGTGVFTAILQQALPGWRVYGTDISTVALAKARTRFPECTFFAPGDSATMGQISQFDLVLTHHTLEHLYDLAAVWAEIIAYVKPDGAMLHVLPCGNPGSFEHRLCLLKRNGIDPAAEHRFCFEDTGHLRRLTTEGLRALAAGYGFTLTVEAYANQHAGGVERLTQTHPLRMLEAVSPRGAVSAWAALRLLGIALWLVPLYVWRLPATLVERIRWRKDRGTLFTLLLVVAAPFYLLSRPLDRYLIRRAGAEWDRRRGDRNGSEMYLYFTRRSTGSTTWPEWV